MSLFYRSSFSSPVLHAAAMLVGAFFAIAAAQAAPGNFDTSFGVGGKALFDLGTGSGDTANAIARDASGNIYLAGASNALGSNDFAVAKISATGSLVTTFGTGGKTLVDIGTNSNDQAYAIALDANSNIYLAGVSDANGAYEFTVVKLDGGGHLVNGFGVGGKVSIANSPGGNDACGAVLIDAAGNLYLIGRGLVSGKSAMKVVKLDNTGQPVSTFGVGGVAIVNYSPSAANVTAGVLDGAGNIIVMGSVARTVNNVVDIDMAAVKLDSFGQVDVHFGSNGTALIDASSLDQGAAIARDKAGNLFLVGKALGTDNMHSDFLVAELDASGNPSATFGLNGKKTIDINSNSADVATSVQIDADDNLYIAGSTVTSNVIQTAVVELDNTGAFVTAFGTAGIKTIDMSAGVYSGTALLLDPGNRLYAVATRTDISTGSDFAVAKLLTAPPNEIFLSGFEAP